MLEIGKDIPAPKGADLPTIDELRLLIETGGQGLIKGSDDFWHLIKHSETHWIGMPGPEFGGTLYRGEPKRYLETKPSLLRLSNQARNNLEIGRLEYLVLTAKLVEFYSVIQRYPGIQELSTWKVANKTGFTDFESQAQHYGLATMLVDFSRSLDVAEFFARCRKVKGPSALWEAIPQEQFSGQLLTLDLAQILKSPSSHKELVFMGPSPFMRPHRQKAWGIFTEGRCIQNHPLVSCTTLEFSAPRASELLAKFDNGGTLFPSDLLSKIANRIRDSKSIAYQSLLIAKKNIRAPQNMSSLQKDLGKLLEYTVEDRIPLVSEDEFNQFGWEWDMIKKEYANSANLRWVSPLQILD